MPCYSSICAREKYAVSIAAATVVCSVCLCAWMLNVLDDNEKESQKRRLKSTAKCLGVGHSNDRGDMKSCENLLLSGYSGRIPSKCVGDLAYRKMSRKMIHDVQIDKREQTLSASKQQKYFLTRTSEDLYESPRIIVQWYPRAWETEGNSSTWKSITTFERHRSTFTVSSGPPGVFSDGALVVPETGLYYMYVKLGFSCRVADGRIGHVAMQVSVEEPRHYPRFAIMSEKQREVCREEGDLTTIYQSGLFRFEKDSSLRVHYQGSSNVEVTKGVRGAFKSFVGMYRVGLA